MRLNSVLQALHALRGRSDGFQCPERIDSVHEFSLQTKGVELLVLGMERDNLLIAQWATGYQSLVGVCGSS